MTSDLDPLGIVGTTIDDKYRVVELAGEGGYGTVYKAEHLIWQEPIALKFFTLLKSADPELREHLLDNFIQEGKLMTQLSSRSTAIVQARDIGKLNLEGEAWIPFMVLEWLEGASLEEVLMDEQHIGLVPRSLQEVIRLLDPVAEAVEVAHASNVAHRDLKPANILIVGDARSADVGIKVLDFGIAKVMAEHQQLQEQLKQTGQQLTAFTPQYGAPEQFSRRFGATGPWTDVYAMALIVVELLRGGHSALQGESLFELGEQTSDLNKRPTPRSMGIELGDLLETVFAQALAVRPEDRFSTMGEFWQELRRHGSNDSSTWPRARGVSSPAMRSSAPRSLSSSAGSSMPPRSDPLAPTVPVTAAPLVTTTPEPDTSKRRRTVIVAALAGAAVALVASFVWLGGDEAPGVAADSGSPTGVSGPSSGASAATSAPAADTAPSAAPAIDPSAAGPDPSAAVTAPPVARTFGKPPGVAPPTTTSAAPPASPPTAPVPPPTSTKVDPWNPDDFGDRR